MVRDSGEFKMEQTFYDDSYVSNMNREREQMKRSLTLDFNGKGNNKRPKFGSDAILSSPDVNKLCVSTPDMEKIILANHIHGEMTPTPTSILFSNQVVTREQKEFTQGFIDALSGMRDSDSSQGVQSTDASRTGSTNTFINLDSYPVYSFGLSPEDETTVKDEPEAQLVPSLGSSSPVSPIDMESQERYKLERKRLRNRVAASKCRKKKLERIATLENKVKVLKGENSDLTVVVNRLREEVCRLKEEVINHVRSGCKISHQASLQHL